VDIETIERCFQEGDRQAELDEARDAIPSPCPHSIGTDACHWWTRGYSYKARAIIIHREKARADAAEAKAARLEAAAVGIFELPDKDGRVECFANCDQFRALREALADSGGNERVEIVERDYDALRELFDLNPSAAYSRADAAEARERAVNERAARLEAALSALVAHLDGYDLNFCLQEENETNRLIAKAREALADGGEKGGAT
jgi:hypothetical protein